MGVHDHFSWNAHVKCLDSEKSLEIVLQALMQELNMGPEAEGSEVPLLTWYIWCTESLNCHTACYVLLKRLCT